VGLITLIPLGGYQQRNAVASFHSASVIFCSMLIRAMLVMPETKNAIRLRADSISLRRGWDLNV